MKLPKLKSISKLPADVTEEILCRLPTKSLVRFRCLSRKFCSLMDDPDFIERYLNTNSNHRLIVSGNMPICFLNWDQSLDDLTLPPVDDDPFNNENISSLMGSCNGLVALYNSYGCIDVCNPSTKELQMLPDFKPNFCHTNYVHDGFGYDVASDDYKLVRIELYYIRKEIEISIHNLKANSRRVIQNCLDQSLRFRHAIGAFVGGALHWLAIESPKRKEYIFSFDLKNEKTSQLALPDLIENSYMHLDVLGGCLCASCTRHGKGVLEVWVMKAYGVKESWTKLFSLSAGEDAIGSSPNFRKFSVYSMYGDKVLFGNDEGFLYWYDLSEKRVKIVKSHGWLRGLSKVRTCVNSLNLFELIEEEMNVVDFFQAAEEPIETDDQGV